MAIQTQLGVKRAFEQAGGLLQKNRLVEAESVLFAALEDHPNEPNLLRLLGLSLLKQGRSEEAAQKLTQVTRLVPSFAQAHEDLAEALFAHGKIEEAVKSFRTSLKHNPNSELANLRLAELLALLGRGTEADDFFERSFELNPDRKALVEAMELQQHDQPEKAEEIYRNVLRRDPDNVDALRLMGVLAMKQEQYNDAEALIRRAVELAPDYIVAWNNLGAALNEQGKHDEAEEAYQRALQLGPKNVNTICNMAGNCASDGRLDEAVERYRQALDLNDSHYPSLLGLGHVLKTLGHQDEAIEAYRNCAKSRPDFGEVYWSLANLKTFRFEDHEIEAMEQQLLQDELDEAATVAFSFALGKAYEDRGDFQRAFDNYERGNEKKRMLVNYDPIKAEISNDRIVDVFTKEFFAERKEIGHSDDAPILVVGLPRSGSTLIEQILASHSKIEGTAELSDLSLIASATGHNRTDGIKYPQTMLELKSQDFEDLGKEYIEKTMHHRTGTPYFIDKMPNNFPAIGFLHAVLPNAKVIDARRHPLDSCFGTFKQLFAKGQVFSYDLFDLAHYYNQYQRMIDHWDDVLPGKVLQMNYEDVVADLEGQARRMLDHCGLEWEDQVLRYYETKRAVKTASSEQVRQPIYRGSLNFWRNYEEQLQPLIEYLEPNLMRLPESKRPKSLLQQD